VSWQALVSAEPELATFGAQRLHDQVAYLATVRADGSPRLHPVRPVLADGRLFVFTEAASPKVVDLARDGRFALHCTATGAEPWDLHEFVVEGSARRVEDSRTRELANASSALPRGDRFVLYELDVVAAMSTSYGIDGRPHRERWRTGGPKRSILLMG
jgi:hypothetical protein